MNHITIELCKEDRQRLDEVIAFLGLIAGEMKNQPATKAPVIDHPAEASTAHLEIPVADSAPAEPEPAPVEPAPTVKVIPFAEFQAAVTRVVAKGPEQKKAAREIISKYGGSVSAVPEDKRAEAMAELAKI